jgi:D-tyrosyl-tRNA(Tyr) deacylase
VRVVLQRVSKASVSVAGEVVGSIGEGLVALVCAEVGDTVSDADALARKVARVRLFRSPERDFDRSVVEIGGGVLCVSQFTLAGRLRRGTRPSWDGAAPGARAEALVLAFASGLETFGVMVAHGVFGANMEVTLVGDGPVTLVIDSVAAGAGLSHSRHQKAGSE